MALRFSAPPSTLLALCAALLAGCASEAPTPPPNVVLITLDTTRVDHLSGYGYERQTTPALDAFAEEGALFELAYAPIATTGPSHSTMFTALYPLAHRVIKNGIPLAEEQVTLAETLSSLGYQTAAIVSSFVLTERFGFAQGFDFFDDEFTAEGASVRGNRWENQTFDGGFDRRANETTRRATDWLEQTRNPNRPFFLFVHYFDPHSPYSPPEGFRGRFGSNESEGNQKIIDLYDEEIAFTDHHVGILLELLEKLKLAGDTIVVVTSDHGEGLGQHDHDEHGINIFDESVRVPLLVRWPGQIPAGRRLAEPVEFVDLVPTLLALIGEPTPEPPAQGHSLAAALLGTEQLEANRPVFLHRRHYEPGMSGTQHVAGQKFGVRLANWKLIIGPAEQTLELYDLEADPGESINLYDQEPERVAVLTALLEDWRKSVKNDEPIHYELSDEDREGLGALGYTE